MTEQTTGDGKSIEAALDSQPGPTIDLEDVRERDAKWPPGKYEHARLIAMDRRALIREVDRLRAEIATRSEQCKLLKAATRWAVHANDEDYDDAIPADIAPIIREAARQP